MVIRIIGLLACAGFIASAPVGLAEESKQFRIGTGEIGGTYYPIGQIVAGALGAPAGARACAGCRIPGLRATAVTSPGSVENIEAVTAGWMEAAFVQSDVASWAFEGTGIFSGAKAHTDIRAIASLYPESVHLVVRATTKIETLAALKNRVVGVGESESGTLVDARLILAAAGLEIERDLTARYLSPSDAAAQLVLGEIDAFFTVAGYPASNVSRAMESGNTFVMPLKGPAINTLLKAHKFLSRGTIPANTYGNPRPIPTVNVNALMIVSAKAGEEFIYRLTKALWRVEIQEEFKRGHPKGKLVTLDTALDGIGIPIHRGAARYYREINRLK